MKFQSLYDNRRLVAERILADFNSWDGVAPTKGSAFEWVIKPEGRSAFSANRVVTIEVDNETVESTNAFCWIDLGHRLVYIWDPGMKLPRDIHARLRGYSTRLKEWIEGL